VRDFLLSSLLDLHLVIRRAAIQRTKGLNNALAARYVYVPKVSHEHHPSRRHYIISTPFTPDARFHTHGRTIFRTLSIAISSNFIPFHPILYFPNHTSIKKNLQKTLNNPLHTPDPS
jgi:hypothetical protein